MGTKLWIVAILVNATAVISPPVSMGLLVIVGVGAAGIGLTLLTLTIAATIRDCREDRRVQREYEEGLSYERANGGGR